MNYTPDKILADIERIAALKPHARVLYAVSTCWWCIDAPPEFVNPRYEKHGLPCDPRGSMLMETNNLKRWLQAAKDNPDHYGKHGLLAFMAAYHGNVCATNGNPTSASSWQEYNDLIDRSLPEAGPE